MAAGLAPTTKNQVDGQAGTLALQILSDMIRAQQFKAWLDTQTDSALIALGYAQADVNVLRSAFNDLNTFANVFLGASAQATAYDFRTFAKQIYGFGVV